MPKSESACKQGKSPKFRAGYQSQAHGVLARMPGKKVNNR